MKKICISSHETETTLGEIFELFITRKRALNLSPESLVYYENCFKYFTGYCSENEKASNVGNSQFYGFITYLKKEKKELSPITINSYLRGIRAILYFGMAEGLIPEFKVSLIKQEKKVKETYTEKELEKLLTKPNIKKCEFAEYRNWVMINYLLGTGNRLSSMISLKIDDVDFDNSAIIIRKTKNRQQQIIPLSLTLSKVLGEYLVYRQGKAEETLFCDDYGMPMTKSMTQKAIAQYNKNHGVMKTSIHIFRHTFAKNWILNGGDIFRLQKILGHSTLEIVKEYVNMFNADLQANFDAFNPLDKITKNKDRDGNKIRL